MHQRRAPNPNQQLPHSSVILAGFARSLQLRERLTRELLAVQIRFAALGFLKHALPNAARIMFDAAHIAENRVNR
jgi:hypothetical protein